MTAQNMNIGGLLPASEVEEKLEQSFAAWNKDVWISVSEEISEEGPLAGMALAPSAEEIAQIDEETARKIGAIGSGDLSGEAAKDEKAAKPAALAPKKRIGPTQVQQIIISQNAILLEDRKAFSRKAAVFEQLLGQIIDDQRRQELRGRYCIHFDHHHFKNGFKDFSNYHFPCAVSFDGTNFGNGDVSFEEARFGASLSISGARFGRGKIILDRMIVEKDLHFTDPVMHLSNVSAQYMQVKENLALSGNFSGDNDFTGVQIGGEARFGGAKFDRVPDFRTAQFAKGLSLSRLNVARPTLTRFWPPKSWHDPKSDDYQGADLSNTRLRLFSRAKNPDEAEKLRALKNIAASNGDNEKRGLFFARELRAKRGIEIENRIGLTVNSLYYYLSDFGQSITRPVFWLFMSLVGFFLAYNVAIGLAVEPFARFSQAFGLSIASLLPLGLGGGEGALGVLSRLQQVFGGVMLVFFVLGVYNKYRLK